MRRYHASRIMNGFRDNCRLFLCFRYMLYWDKNVQKISDIVISYGSSLSSISIWEKKKIQLQGFSIYLFSSINMRSFIPRGITVLNFSCWLIIVRCNVLLKGSEWETYSQYWGIVTIITGQAQLNWKHCIYFIVHIFVVACRHGHQ